MNKYDILTSAPFIIVMLATIIYHVVEFGWNGVIEVLSLLILIAFSILWMNHFIKKSNELEWNKR